MQPAIAIVAADDVSRQRLVRALAGRHAWPVDELPAGTMPAAIVVCCEAADAPRAVARLGDVAAPVVLVAAAVTPAEVRSALAAGVQGIVLEEAVESALDATLEAVLAGQLVLPPSGRAHLAPPPLSTREKQVLGLVVLGLSNADIAAKLHVTEATVKSHLTACFRKLGVRTRSAAAARILDPHDGLGIGILSLAEPDTSLDVFAEDLMPR